MVLKKNNYAFVDGSYDETHHVYGWGVVLVDKMGHEHQIMGADSKVRYALMRNVAGEIIAVMEAVKKALKLKMKCLHIYHDYEGCARWVNGTWQTKKKETRDYANFIKGIDPKLLKITFEHVKGHSGVDGNDRADELAKEAIKIYITQMERRNNNASKV